MTKGYLNNSAFIKTVYLVANDSAERAAQIMLFSLTVGVAL